MNENDWLYDLEIYPNLFLLGAKNVVTKDRVSFQVSPYADNRHEIIQWLKDDVRSMIGYNNLEYDYPLLYLFITKYFKFKGSVLTNSLFKESVKIVTSKNRFGHRYQELRKQIDLFKINHFDNKARMTSLKLLEFNLRLDNLQSLPYPYDQPLTQEQIWDIVAYNHNDNDAAERVLEHTIDEIVLREKMSEKFGMDFTNFNSTKMGEHILIQRITGILGKESMYNKVPTASGEYTWSPKKTVRESIDLNEVVFDTIKFKTAPFKAITQWFRSQVITDTNGVFSNIPVENLKIIEDHYAKHEEVWDTKKRKFVTKSTITPITKKNPIAKLRTLNVVYRDFRYDFGVGGIHGCIKPGIYEAGDEHFIIDIDVKSYYPNLSIKYGFYPEHVGPQFCIVYENIYEERNLYDKRTHKTENLALKLALNGSYGKSNSAYSALYDPKYTMLTTINGQLLLCKLSEQLNERIPGALMLQINTDGLTIKVKKHFKGVVEAICAEWEKDTKLELEYAYYDKMIIKDVNNYIGVYTDGKCKRKGATFIYKMQPGELELHKNFSQLVVPRALEAYFINGADPENFINNHDDIYDFFLRTKVPRACKMYENVYDQNHELVSSKLGQNMTRYLVTGKYLRNKETKTYMTFGQGTTFIKAMPSLKGDGIDREINIEKGWLCTEVNRIPKDTMSLEKLIDIDYYLDKVLDVIEIVEYHQNQTNEE